MNGQDVEKAKDVILDVLGWSEQPCSPQDLVGLLGVDDSLDEPIREAIWELLDDKKIELTTDRRLALAK